MAISFDENDSDKEPSNRKRTKASKSKLARKTTILTIDLEYLSEPPLFIRKRTSNPNMNMI